ncbi:LuxR C-terminal-related transcriptional regulator [Nocardia sp. NPDC004604]|uniref:helix-turn-helix transcriptional regulator n=1 Tax=Nocardia sp. NPDC004604 TaxID=3157013 RepID=UPI0033BCF4D1
MFSVSDRGEHLPVPITSLGWPHRNGALPAEVHGVVGRQPELRRIESLLASDAVRLITLVGSGGIGKTTLAAEALQRFRNSPNRKAYWARLARLAPGTDTDTVAEEVMQSVAKADATGQSAWTGLVEALSESDPVEPHTTVLVLDNCEHVLSGVASLIAVLLDVIPRLTIVATSREPIGWIDEHIVDVPPLPTAAAVELFRQRAELTGRSIPDDPEQIAIAEQICRRVDNNPLFIRLAAARLLHRPPAGVLREVTGDIDDSRLRWSHSIRAGTEQRHRSLRDVVAWSYGLCTEPEQLLLDRMSVFATSSSTDSAEISSGGAEAEAIRAVCADTSLPAEHIEQLLERLVERSLVSRHISSTTVRYFLLESVRVFARDRLRRRDDDLDETRLLARHRRYYRDKVVAGQEIWLGPGEKTWYFWVSSAWENILIGIETSFDDPAEAIVGLETVAVLMALLVPFFGVANRAATHLTERALQAIRHVDPTSTRLRVNATALLAWNAIWQGEIAYAAQLLDECAALCLPNAEPGATWRDTPTTDMGLPAYMEFSWGIELMFGPEPAAVDVLSRARRKFAEAGDRAGEQRSELFEGFARSIVGDSRALTTARRHLDLAITAEAGWTLSWARLVWLYAVSVHGEIDEAVTAGRTALDQFLAGDDTFLAGWFIPIKMMALAHTVARRIASGDGDPAELKAGAIELACMLGMTATANRAQGIASERLTWMRQEMALAVDSATKVLGADIFTATVQQAQELRPEFEELQPFMRNLVEDRLPRTGTTDSRWRELSPAEREVAILAAAGWANSAIAARRGNSTRTVDAQMATILRKLTVTSRSDLIGHIPDEFGDRITSESRQRPTRSRSRR